MIRYWEEDTETEIGKPFDLEKHDKELSDKWLAKIKQAREEIQKLRGCSCNCSDGVIDDVEDILDKLIESEGVNE